MPAWPVGPSPGGQPGAPQPEMMSLTRARSSRSLRASVARRDALAESFVACAALRRCGAMDRIGPPGAGLLEVATGAASASDPAPSSATMLPDGAEPPSRSCRVAPNDVGETARRLRSVAKVISHASHANKSAILGREGMWHSAPGRGRFIRSAGGPHQPGLAGLQRLSQDPEESCLVVQHSCASRCIMKGDSLRRNTPSSPASSTPIKLTLCLLALRRLLDLAVRVDLRLSRLGITALAVAL